MKSIHLLLGVLLAASTLQAQTLNQATANPSALPAPTPYAIVAQDANDQVWQWDTYEQAPDGSAVPHIHQYTELATGLNHLVNGQWVASSEQIEISPDGSSASATNGQHQAYFPGDIYNGAIKLVTPDGQTLQSQPIGLGYFDGTNSVLIAVVTNATGAIVPSGNQVIYTNAFDGLKADLLYTYTKAGFEQDVILREQPPDPDSLGLNPATTRLQVLTEFFNPPQPSVTATTVPTAAGNLENDSLSFGTMAMGRGRAFLVGNDEPAAEVNKRWLLIQGRQFLIEEVPIVSIASEIDTLPPYVAQAGSGTRPVVSRNLILPPQRLTHTSPKTTFLAQAAPLNRGLVLDYVTMTSQTNYTFQSDTTYYISGTVNLSGTNTFEGGAVIKYTNSSSISLGSGTGLNWMGSAYRPVIFTAMDDNSVGETINGSSGSPSGYYAGTALSFTTTPTFTISHFRIAWAAQAIGDYDSPLNFYDGQLVNCQFGITSIYSSINVRNLLFGNVQTNFSGPVYGGIDIQNSTFAGSSYLTPNLAFGGMSLENCILANVTNLTNSVSYAGFTGTNNGFYNSPAFGSNQKTNNSNPFQTVGAGSYYLASSCVFTNAGTTNIDPTLLADLHTRTTHPPIVYSNATVTTTNLILGPQAIRDTNATPDLGYHYDPLDYAFGGAEAYSNLTFTAGTAIGLFQLPGSGGPGYSLSLHGQITVAFNGTVTTPCVSARYDTVQEGGNGNWTDTGWLGGIKSYEGNVNNVSVAAQIVANFTRFCCAMGPPHFRDYYAPLVARITDCEFYSGTVGTYNNCYYFTNCLFDRLVVAQVQGYNSGDALTVQNCTWHGGQLQLTPNYNPIPLNVRDCAFEGTTFSISSYGSNTNYASYDYNAYTNGAAQLPIGGTHDVIVTNSYNWQRSWFGNYYLPPTSPILNQGDVPASQLGLYHFTTQTNQVPEGTNTVSIGYHYVATDAYGNPLDSNGDGIPDYLEDANGNGIYDSGDLGDWQNLNLNVIITRPRNGSILP